jgi:RimJ/RimL family protein N-acetyltransferase
METGPDFREEHELQGLRVVLRHIRPDDAAELRRGFAALSSESRYRRFFGPVGELDDRTVEYLTRVDGNDHVAIIALTESLDLKSERGIGVVRFVRLEEDREAAEIAITVVDDMQRHGVGTLLADVAMRAARERGIKRFVGEVLIENAALVEALRAHPAVQTTEKNGTLSFVLDLDSKRDVNDLLRQMLAIAAQRVFLVLRWLRPKDGSAG